MSTKKIEAEVETKPETPTLNPTLDNEIFVLILRHPQEQDKELGTAPLLEQNLKNIKIRTGLSSANLSKALGRTVSVDPKKWAVLFLGTIKGSEGAKQPVTFVRNGTFLSKDVYSEIEGIVAIDGNWKQAKTLWWRNPWLLKLNRVLLKPTRPSLYGRLRKEPRRECLSTLESVAMALEVLEKSPNISAHLINTFKAFLETRKKPTDKKKEAPADKGDAP